MPEFKSIMHVIHPDMIKERLNVLVSDAKGCVYGSDARGTMQNINMWMAPHRYVVLFQNKVQQK